MNMVILSGRLGKDPVFTDFSNNKCGATISLATTRRYTDSKGNLQEETQWHTVVAYGSFAKVLRDYAKKGMKILVEGSIQYRKWQDANGNDRISTEILVNSLELPDRVSSINSN